MCSKYTEQIPSKHCVRLNNTSLAAFKTSSIKIET